MANAVDQVRQTPRTELDAEGLGGNVFEMMRLVKDDVIVFGQDAGVGVGGAQSQVAEEEGVVDDDEFALGGGPAGAEIEAGVIVAAELGAAGVLVAGDL